MDSEEDQNFYRIITLLLIFTAVIFLAAIQFCNKKLLFAVFRLLTCKELGSCPGKSRERKQSAANPVSTRSLTTVSNESDARRDKKGYAKGSHSIDVSNPTESRESVHEHLQMENVMHRPVDDQEIVVVTQDEDAHVAAYSFIEDADNHKHPFWNAEQNVYEVDETVHAAQEQLRLHPLNQRRRRSGVCTSMPEGKVLLSSPRHSMSFEVMDDKNGLPELQVNGIYCKSDQECSSSNIESKSPLIGSPKDEGKIQCVVKYNIESQLLVVHSVTVKAEMDVGVPGFVVEVAILPKENAFEKSRMYVINDSHVDLTLKEIFEMNCTQADVEKSTLFLAVKPMYSGAVLYAETKLKDLSLDSGKEILLGGFLKNLH